MDQIVRHELCDHFVSQPFDVQRPAGGEVDNMLADLGRAGDADAPVGNLALHPDDSGAAFRAGLRHDEGLFRADSCGLDDLDDLGNDVARPLNHYRIP
jgi:hypothetical protein